MAAPHGSLHRVLGVGFGLAVVLGGAVGVGILRTPGTIAGMLQRPELVLLVWALAGGYCLLQANNLGELAAAIPRSGGSYVFARRALGPYGGFLIGWGDWLSLAVATAYLPLAFGEYTARLFPAVAGREVVVAIGVLLAFLALQLTGVRAGSRTQQVVSILKGGALLAFVVLCLTAPGASALPVHAADATPAMRPSWIAFAGALQLVIGAYGGWYSAAFFGEEQSSSGTSVPRALLLGVAAVTAIYLLVNLAYMHVLPMSEFAASKLPAANAMQRVAGGNADRWVTILSLLLLLGIVNALLMIAPRTLFALARDGLFVRRASSVTGGGTPGVATIVTVAAAIALTLIGSFERLFALTAFLIIVVDATSTVSLLVLRRREPALTRPYRAVGYPFTTIVALVASLALLAGFVASDPATSGIAVALMACSYPLFRVATRRHPATTA